MRTMNSKNIKIYDVKEGDSGVLYLTDQYGNTEKYQPDCDLDKTQELLYEFYQLKTNKGTLVKDSFVIDSRDWFPNTVCTLYWQYFFQLVKYRKIIDKYIENEIAFSNISSGRFKKLILLIDGVSDNILKKYAKNFYHKIICLRNHLMVRKNGDILLYKYTIDDFRVKEISQELESEYNILNICWVDKKNVLKNLFNRDIFYYSLPSPIVENKVQIVNEPSFIFSQAIRLVQSTIKTQIIAKNNIAKTFRLLNYKLFLGLDDANVVYPLLYSSKEVGIRTVGIQHGLYARRHEAYILNSIDCYDWYENVIVWGKYWKDIVVKNSRLFSNDYHLVGSNKHTYKVGMSNYNESNNKTILIPYEYVADTIKVGEYIKKLIDCGFEIYFKLRTDRITDVQIKAYELDDYESKIHIINDISPSIMDKIDIVAGSMTTLLFDLLPYKKPIWVFDTSFRLLYDMVEADMARLITEADMAEIENIYIQDMKNNSNIDLEYVSGKTPIVEIVKDILNSIPKF